MDIPVPEGDVDIQVADGDDCYFLADQGDDECFMVRKNTNKIVWSRLMLLSVSFLKKLRTKLFSSTSIAVLGSHAVRMRPSIQATVGEAPPECLATF